MTAEPRIRKPEHGRVTQVLRAHGDDVLGVCVLTAF